MKFYFQILLCFATVMGLGRAEAATGKNPEYIWQPASGEIAFAAEYAQTPEYELKTTILTTETVASRSKETKSGIRGSLGYGFSDNLSVSVGTSSFDSKSASSGGIESKRSGLGDFEAILATSWGGSYRLHAGLGAAYSPGKRKDPRTGAAGPIDGNQYSGGIIFAPYVGFSIPIAGASWIGIVGTFESKQERKFEDSTGSENKVTGGNVAQVMAFWEIPFRSLLVDLAGGVRTTDKDKTTTVSGVVTETASYSATLAQVDLKYMFSPSTLLGARYVMLMNPDFLVESGLYTVKAVNVSEISLLLRFAF